ncbi:MAG: hypothetical protein ACM3ME_07240, partial [Chloroflexota bacterium]
ELVKLSPDALYWAANTQLDPALTRALFARRATVPEPIKSRLTLLCERTFNVRLGNSVEDWAGWLAQ